MREFLDGLGNSPAPRAASQPLAPSLIDHSIADALPGYRLVREIARGGQGIVYEGVQIETRRRVAVKMIEPAGIGQKGSKSGGGRAGRARRRVEREAEISAGLRHPNIVTVYDSASLPDGRYALAMEYVDGPTLDDWARRIDSASLTDRPALRECVRTKLRAVAAVCDAVQYAHQNGVIHRDLKPANVLMGEDGLPRVVDFGIARRTVPEAGITRAGEFAGTLAYASPEQVSGDPDAVDTRSDVYSLGVILYEVLAGRRPYETERSLTGAIANITRSDPEPLRIIQPGNQAAGDELETVVRKALSKDRDHRYQTAGELRTDIENWLAGRAVDAKRESALYVLRKTAARYRGAVAAAVGFLLLLTAFAIAMAWSARKLDRQRVLLAASLASSTIERGRLLSVSGTSVRAESLIWPELLRTRADVTDPGLGFDSPPEVTQAAWALYELYSRQAGIMHLRSLPNAVAVEFENDRHALSVLCSDGARELRSIPDGRVLEVVPPTLEPVSKDTLADVLDRRMVVLGKGVIEVRDLMTARRELLSDPAFGELWWAALSSDARHLATVGSDGVLRLWSCNPLRPVRPLASGMIRASRAAFSHDGELIAGGTGDEFKVWRTDDGSESASWRIADELWVRALRPIINVVDFSFDRRRIAAGVGVWVLIFELDKPETPPLRIAAHRGFLNGVQFSRDMSVLLSSGSERSYRAWNPTSGELIGNLDQSVASGGRPALANDGSLAAALELQDTVRVWETHPRNWLTRLTGPENSVHCVRFSPDGRLVAASSADGSVRAWRVGDRAPVWTARPGTVPATSVSFSPDGATLAIGRSTGEVMLCDAATGANSRPFCGGPEMLTWIGFSPNGASLATAGADGQVHLHDARSGAETAVLTGHTSRVVECAFRPDGRELTSTSGDGLAMVWDLATGTPRLRLEGPGVPVRAVAYSPDGAQIATGGDDWSIRLWDARTGACQRTLRDAKQHLFGLVYHPKQNLLFSCCRDSVIQVWDTRTGREVAALDGHDSFVLSLAISPDGCTLATGGGDRTVGMWDLRYYQTHVKGNADFWRRPGVAGRPDQQ